MSSLKKDYTRVFAKVFLAELDYIHERRNRMNEFGDQPNKKSQPLDPLAAEQKRLEDLLLKNQDSDPDSNEGIDEDSPHFDIRPGCEAGLVGLAMSGGGIRSATFNLGLLQALAKCGILRLCDYISTVSGGGYIGACLSSLLNNPDTSVTKDKFPFRYQRKDDPDETKEVKHLRRHGCYLAIDRSLFRLDVWRIGSTVLSGLVLTNLTPFALGIIIAYVLHKIISVAGSYSFTLAGTLFSISFIALIIMVLTRAYGAFRNLGFDGRRRLGYFQATLALIAIILLLISGLIILAFYLPSAKSEAYNLMHGISLVSIFCLVTGLMKIKTSVFKKLFNIIFRIALIATLPVLFAEFLRWLWATKIFETYFFLGLPALIWIALILLLFGLFINTNRISLHHFYRDRLSKAYIIIRKRKSNDREEIAQNEALILRDLHMHHNGPYHLINATLNVPGSRNRYLRGRGADFFLFSKLYCGSESTGYIKTEGYEKGEVRLATAMAVSGAAASPQMGLYSSPFLTFLMTLFNVRLNRFMPNPNHRKRFTIKLWPLYFVKELLGRCKETDSLLNLSDGGHHENLGVYSLLKRRCRIIIASDAAADQGFQMMDFANLQRKARIDLGVDIVVQDKDQLQPDPESGYTESHYLLGTIRYPEGKEGKLIYIKSCLTGDEPADILAYRRKNPSFPDETTADQFFDESQFESYRKLGELIGNDVFSNAEVQKLLN